MDFVAKPFHALTLRELHDLLRLRVDVFVVEQQCPYPEIDGKDPQCWHLLGWLDGVIEACARWYVEGDHVRLGRIATSARARGLGHGRRLMAEAFARIGPRPILIHAQVASEGFYRSLGFSTASEPFDDYGVPHVVMVRPPR